MRKLQFLVSAVRKDVRELAQTMCLPADAIIIEQGEENRYEELTVNGHEVRCYHLAERGVGLSRNHALMRADAEISVISDEDIVYRADAAETIVRAFAAHPEADMLLFNVKVQESRRTYQITSFGRVRWYNCGRYPAYSFAFRTETVRKKRITFPLLYGGGARYSNGEDSLFISDCLKKGMKIYAVPEEIGEEIPRPSTWFFGYDDTFFYDRGVLYDDLYGRLAPLMGARWLLKNQRVMCEQLPLKKAWALLNQGIRDGRAERTGET